MYFGFIAFHSLLWLLEQKQSAHSLYAPSTHVFGGDGQGDGTEYFYSIANFVDRDKKPTHSFLTYLF